MENIGPIWVTGSEGLIGGYLRQTAPSSIPADAIHFLTRKSVDLTNHAAVEILFKRTRPKLIIHTAAMSRSIDCEKNPELAWKINLHATTFLAGLASNSRLVFFSTDLVFDGQKGNYSEVDKVNPLSVYAETKTAAESVVLQNKKNLVIRTSLNGGRSKTGDRSFNEEMRKAWSGGRTLKLFRDEFRSPIAAKVTSDATWRLALNPETEGLLHLAGSERLSRLAIGEHLRSRWTGLECAIEPSSLKDYSGPRRAPDTSLNIEKAQRYLPFKLPKFSSWLVENPDEPF